MVKSIVAGAFSLALVTVPIGQAAEAACVPQADGAALMTFIMPTLIDQMAVVCRGVLPMTTALMNADGLRRVSLRADAEVARPAALRAIATMTDVSTADVEELSIAMEQELASSAATAITKELSKKDCPQMASAFDALAPMSGRDLGQLVLAIVGGEALDVCRSGA